MLIYTMLKPGFDTKQNIEELKQNYFTPENNIDVVVESKVQYDKNSGAAHYDNLKETPFFGETVDYISSAPAYAIIINYNGDETKWAEVRSNIFGATKNPAPGSVRYDFTIGRGEEYNIGTNVIHSSDSKVTAANEIGIFIDLLSNDLKNNKISQEKFDEIMKKLSDVVKAETDKCQYYWSEDLRNRGSYIKEDYYIDDYEAYSRLSEKMLGIISKKNNESDNKEKGK